MQDDIAPGRPGILRIDPYRAAMEPLELDPAGFQSPLPVQHYHLIFEDEEIGLAVGIWDTTTMQETFGPYPGDEFITVLDGGFAMVDAAGETLAVGRTGDSVTFRNGIPTSWKQEGYLRKIYLTLVPPGAAPPAIESATGGVNVLPGVPAAGGEAKTLYRNDAGTMTVTLRQHDATALPAMRTGAHELCRILTGEMVFTDAEGQAHVFAAGDHVFLPAGLSVARATRAGTTAYHVHVTA
jgi:uncharacterized cupin superfamily protein